PFDMQELLSRIKSLLRRPHHFLNSIHLLANGTIKIDTQARTVEKDGATVHLKPLEFSVLEFFLGHPGQVVEPEALLLKVWNQVREASKDSVYACIKNIRKKLGFTRKDSPIQTVHGVGYRFDPESSRIK